MIQKSRQGGSGRGGHFGGSSSSSSSSGTIVIVIHRSLFDLLLNDASYFFPLCIDIYFRFGNDRIIVTITIGVVVVGGGE